MLFSKNEKIAPERFLRPLCSNRNLTIVLLLGVLAYVMLTVFLGLHFTAGDDAGWFKYTSLQHRQTVVNEWATSQGRVYVYFVGTAMLYVNNLSGSPFSEFMQYAPYFLSCFIFAFAINAYFNARLALATLTLLLGLAALRFDLSAMVGFPLFIFPFIASLLLSIICMRRYALRGGRLTYIVSLGLLLLSYATHESITLLSLAIGGLAVLANLSTEKDRSTPSLRFSDFTPRGRALLYGYVGVTAVYAAVYIGFGALHPSTYDGHVADFSRPVSSLSVLWHFGVNGSVLFGLWDPYTIKYSFPQLSTGLQVEYGPAADFITTLGNPLAVLFGVATAASLWLNFNPPREGCAVRKDGKHPRWLRPAPCGGLRRFTRNPADDSHEVP